MYTPHSMTWYEKVGSAYVRHEVSPVMWQASEIAISDKRGLPRLTRQRCSCRSQQALSPSKGDVLVKGIVPDEITPSFGLSALMAKYPSTIRLTMVDRHDHGSDSARHYELRGGV